MKKTNVKAQIFLRVILILALMLIVAAVYAGATFYIMRRNVSRGADGLTPYIGNNGNWYI